jgi:hypothetical protein
VSSVLLDRAATVARLVAATCLLLAPGLALSYWIFPRRALDALERAYLGTLSSLSLLTLLGVALLEGKGSLDPGLLASCALACAAACAVGAAISRLRRRHAGEGRARRGRAKPGGVARGTSIWVHGTRSYIPAPFVTRVYSPPVCGRRRRRSKRGPVPSVEPASRASGAASPLSCIARRALGPASLIATAALTLLAHRALAPRPLPGGPVVGFSIPSNRLVDTQAALQQGGQLAIPFQVENLSPHDAAYRVEAWAATAPGTVGRVVVKRIDVPAGVTCDAALQVDLPPGGGGVPLDLYLFSGEAAVPLAHLRLWPDE